MRLPCLTFLFFLVLAFTLATSIGPAFAPPVPAGSGNPGLLESVLGESRRLFANQIYLKADVYMHRGFYPSIFEQAQEVDARELHIAEAARQTADASHHEEDEDVKIGQVHDRLEAFGRQFYPAIHTHLGESGTNKMELGEMLPWLKFAAELNPQKVDTYTVGAFFLRQMGKNTEAADFLRQGLRANPGNPEILCELGRHYFDQNDLERGRNLYELAYTQWERRESPKPPDQRDTFLGQEILTGWVRLEVKAGHRDRAAELLEKIKPISPHPENVQKRIEELKSGAPFNF